MVKIWSELPGARFREIVADLATIAWVWVWTGIVLNLYNFLAGFRTVGETIREGGDNVTSAGRDLSSALRQLPLVGENVAGLTRSAFLDVGQPFIQFGTELEQFVVLVAATLALLLGIVTIGPWLVRYLPWRAERLHRVRAAHRVIRVAPDLRRPEVDKILASRALHRLTYPELLEYSPDPFGDWATGRHDRLARAELASVGLKP
jgi:hypothetical protein